MEIIESSMKWGKGQWGVRKGVERMGRENKKNKSEGEQKSLIVLKMSVNKQRHCPPALFQKYR